MFLLREEHVQRCRGMDHGQFQLLRYGGGDGGQRVRGPAGETVAHGVFHTLMDLMHSMSWSLTDKVVGRAWPHAGRYCA